MDHECWWTCLHSKSLWKGLSSEEVAADQESLTLLVGLLGKLQDEEGQITRSGAHPPPWEALTAVGFLGSVFLIFAVRVICAFSGSGRGHYQSAVGLTHLSTYTSVRQLDSSIQGSPGRADPLSKGRGHIDRFQKNVLIQNSAPTILLDIMYLPLCPLTITPDQLA